MKQSQSLEWFWLNLCPKGGITMQLLEKNYVPLVRIHAVKEQNLPAIWKKTIEHDTGSRRVFRSDFRRCGSGVCAGSLS